MVGLGGGFRSRGCRTRLRGEVSRCWSDPGDRAARQFATSLDERKELTRSKTSTGAAPTPVPAWTIGAQHEGNRSRQQPADQSRAFVRHDFHDELAAISVPCLWVMAGTLRYLRFANHHPKRARAGAVRPAAFCGKVAWSGSAARFRAGVRRSRLRSNTGNTPTF
jgi:hypothetical protein